jgi:hypothetical protein
MAASPYLTEYAPEYCAYIAQYPTGRLEGVENFIYWSKEDIGLKPVISVTHVTLYTVTRAGVTNVLVGSKQLYASRYFDSSFALTAFVEEAGAGSQPASYLLYLNRSRTDQLGGLLGGIKRSMVEGRMIRGLKKNLLLTRDRLEADFRRGATNHPSGARTAVPPEDRPVPPLVHPPRRRRAAGGVVPATTWAASTSRTVLAKRPEENSSLHTAGSRMGNDGLVAADRAAAT